MADTFVKIASVTVGAGGASTISFTSIPSTYTDLCLKISARTTLAGLADAILLTINGTTTSITSTKTLQGNGAAASSFNSPTTSDVYAGDTDGSTATSNTFGNTEIYIPNYANTSFAKSLSIDHVMENNATTAYAHLTAGLWNSTSAINSITITRGLSGSSIYAQYSTAVLYGIKNS